MAMLLLLLFGSSRRACLLLLSTALLLLLLLSAQALPTLADEESKAAPTLANEEIKAAPTCGAPTCEGDGSDSDSYSETTAAAKTEAKAETEANDKADANDTTEGTTTETNQSDLAVPELPDMTQGGILVYFHLYKTGGSSITELMVELKNEFEEFDENEDEEEHGTYNDEVNSDFLESKKLVFVNNREDMTDEDIEWSIGVAKDKKKPVFYNFHVEFPNTMYPTLTEAAPVLRAWREAATKAGVPFFVATVLREPLGHSLSFFNFFHVTIDEMEWSPFAGDMDPTEENFIKTFVPNRLCHLMYDDAHGILEAPDAALREGLKENLWHFMDENELNRRNEPSHCDTDKLRPVLFEDGTFDYVGVTERLSTHILPMFTKMVFGDSELARDAQPKKQAEKMTDDTWVPLKKHALSDETKAMVAEKSSKDQQLYEDARDRFAHWPSLLL